MLALDRDVYLAGFSDTSMDPVLRLFSDRDRAEARLYYVTAAISETLPPVFGFGAACGDHWIEAIGETDADGLWVASRVVQVTMRFESDEIIHIITGKDGEEHPIHAADVVDLFRADRLIPAAMARRDAYRAERASHLPSHGGNAICVAPDWLHDGHFVAATGWLDRFLCEDCLSKQYPRENRAAGVVVR